MGPAGDAEGQVSGIDAGVVLGPLLAVAIS